MRVVLGGLVAAVAGAAAVLPVSGMYAPGVASLLLCGAAVGGAGLTAGLRAVRLATSTALLGALVGLGGALVALAAWLPRQSGSTLDALRYSGARILTTSVPLPVTLETMVLPIGGAWLAAAAAAALLHGRRPALAVLPPVALLGGAVAVVGPVGEPAYRYAVLLVAALAALLALAQRGTRLHAVAFVGLAAVVTGIAGPALLAGADRRPADLRARVEPPYQNPEQVNPLNLLAGWAAEPDEALLEVRTDRPARLRLVTLAEFTGVTWLPARTYHAAGTVLPATVASPGPPIRQELTVAGLAGGWLPAPDGTQEVSGVRVAVDAPTATLVAPDGLRAGLRYTVEARPPDWRPDQLVAAELPTDDEFDTERTVPPNGPGRLYEIARLAAGTGSPYEQATRLADHLRRHYRFDARAPGGNGYPSLDRFLLRPAEQGGRRGTSEQFATAFAVLARTLGMPSRVVVGFNVTAAGGPHVVRARDAVAWPEIYLDGAGWVPFDPTPPFSTSDGVVPAPLEPLPTLPPVDPSPSDTAGDAAAPPSVAAPPDAGPPPARRPWWPAAVLAVVVAIPALRLGRGRARLRRGGPADRLLGAWAEIRDGLRLAGHRPTRSSTVDDIARLAGTPALGAAVNGLAFGGAVPPDAEVDALLAGIRAHRRALRHRVGRLRRLTWWLDPRPLWWRRR
ncbi:transglutaminaseTgpA domain-containing protein [Actinomycetes bacterium KLBMP 9797]